LTKIQKKTVEEPLAFKLDLIYNRIEPKGEAMPVTKDGVTYPHKPGDFKGRNCALCDYPQVPAVTHLGPVERNFTLEDADMLPDAGELPEEEQ
jgi:hypothetical protein